MKKNKEKSWSGVKSKKSDSNVVCGRGAPKKKNVYLCMYVKICTYYVVGAKEKKGK